MADKEKNLDNSKNNRSILNESYNKIPDFKFTPDVPKEKDDNSKPDEK